MKIHRLEVQNFRGFEHRDFKFSDQFNILLSDNGTGKTAVLEALAVGTSALFHWFHGLKARPIQDDEVTCEALRSGRCNTSKAQTQKRCDSSKGEKVRRPGGVL